MVVIKYIYKDDNNRMRRYDLIRHSCNFLQILKNSPGTIVDLDFSRWIVRKYGLVRKFPWLFPPLRYLLRSRSHALYQQVSKNITTFSPRIAFYTRPNIFVTKQEDKTSEKKEIHNTYTFPARGKDNISEREAGSSGTFGELQGFGLKRIKKPEALMPGVRHEQRLEKSLRHSILVVPQTVTKTSSTFSTIVQKRAPMHYHYQPFRERVIKTPQAEREVSIRTNIVHINTFQESLRRIKESVSDLEEKIDRSSDGSPKESQSSAPGMNGRPNASREANIDVKYLTDQVYQMLERKIRVERERRGLQCW